MHVALACGHDGWPLLIAAVTVKQLARVDVHTPAAHNRVVGSQQNAGWGSAFAQARKHLTAHPVFRSPEKQRSVHALTLPQLSYCFCDIAPRNWYRPKSFEGLM